MSTKSILVAAAIGCTALTSFWAGRQSISEGNGVPTPITTAAPQGHHGSSSLSALPGAARGGAARTTNSAAGVSTAPSSLADPAITIAFGELNERITAMSPREMTELFTELRTRNDHPQQGLIESILTMHLIGRDPASMIEIKLAYPDLPVLGRTYQQWGQSDPEAALAHIEEMENETWYRQGLGAIFSGLGKAEPERALQALNGISEIDSGHYGSLFAAWTTRSPSQATAAIDRVPASRRATALLSIANKYPEVDDPNGARRWLESLSEADAETARPMFERRMLQLELPVGPSP